MHESVGGASKVSNLVQGYGSARVSEPLG